MLHICREGAQGTQGLGRGGLHRALHPPPRHDASAINQAFKANLAPALPRSRRGAPAADDPDGPRLLACQGAPESAAAAAAADAITSS